MLQTDPTLMKLLTEAERQILRMLALGHTAKTIASLQKISVNVVNERLREARRKTGASSSRTLARTLSETDQKNCPEQIGMAIDLEMGREVPAVGSVSTASRLSSKVKWFMTLLLALAATYAVFSVTHQNPKTDIIQGVSNAPVAIKMQKQLENETEDALWSVNARQVLGSAYKELEGIEIVAVRCGATICEVSGEIKNGAMSRTIKSAANKEFLDKVQSLGFERLAALSFKAEKNENDSGSFMAFWVRNSGK